MRYERNLIDILAKVLYEVMEHKVSLDVAFKKTCRGKCVGGLKEREELYGVVRKFISDYFRLACCFRGYASYRKVARHWLEGKCVPPELIHCIYSYPEWFVNELLKVLDMNELVGVLKAMNERVWWLRVNSLLASEEGVLRGLELEGVEYEVFKEIPYMVRVVSSKKPIRLLRVVKEFKVVPQDLSSAVVVEALNPECGDSIIDLASAPGMKTSLIMMLAENRAKVVACDKSIRRLSIMKTLLRRLGVDLSRVVLIHADSTYLSCRHFDKALVDAPCSNSGAVGKDPGIKISITRGKVIRNSSIQLEMLRNALGLADYITFSTCSIFPEEGEFVIGKLGLERSKFLRPIKWVDYGYPIVSFYDLVMRLMPHKHLCEGFFIASLRLN
ncbi:MAG: RsmB/NOP family class I SAM-dependent RNA methyltransferase [Sulfolobales archaeon]